MSSPPPSPKRTLYHFHCPSHCPSHLCHASCCFPSPSPFHPHSWRSTPAPTSSGDRFANYSSSRPAASSYGTGASGGSAGAKLGSGDLAHLPIDDLRDLVSKVGAQLPREPTRDSVISALISKGVSVNDLSRGEWRAQRCLYRSGVGTVQLCSCLGQAQSAGLQQGPGAFEC